MKTERQRTEKLEKMMYDGSVCEDVCRSVDDLGEASVTSDVCLDQSPK
jgi:hypothetical protein